VSDSKPVKCTEIITLISQYKLLNGDCQTSPKTVLIESTNNLLTRQN
jgi:hypothetical protein